MKKLLAISFAALLLCTMFFCFSASAATVASGTCGANGDNLTWTLDDAGTLTISGTGAMADWSYSSSAAPWYSYRRSIKNVVINNGATSIGDHAFFRCSALTSIDIPDGVTSIGDRAFFSCSSLTSVDIGNGVTSIGNYAFRSCSSLTSVDIPDSVTSIGNYAFSDCSALTSVDIGDGVTSIGDYAFYKCRSLEKIVVDSNNKNYSSDENGVLFNKDKTTLIQFPAGSPLTVYTVPSSVTSIGDYAFYYCSALTSIDIPDSVTSIGSSAFWECSSLTSIDIGDGVTSIGDVAFYNCFSLTSIDIPDSVKTIGVSTFYKCSSLEKAIIPASVTSIGSSAFSSCPELTIYGYTGTTAETYANENNIPFVALDKTTYTSDHLIDLRKIVAGIITHDAFAKTLFDLSGDGTLTTDDLVLLRKKIAGLI